MSVPPLVSSYVDDPDMPELIDLFVADLPERITKIDESVSQQDCETLQRIGHQMKGAGGGYGYDSISAAGKILEDACRTDKTVSPTVRQSAQLLQAQLRAAIAGRPMVAV